MSTEEPKPEDAPSTTAEQPTVEENAEEAKVEEKPAPEEPPKVEEPPKIPSKDITFGYIPEGNMALLTAKDDSIDFMDCHAISIEHGGKKFTYRRNRID